MVTTYVATYVLSKNVATYVSVITSTTVGLTFDPVT